MTIDWLPRIAEADGPLYLTIARAISTDVASGRLQPGDRLPPQRNLAYELGIALGTVTRAYAEAERSGFVVARGRQGTVVANKASAKASRLSGLLAQSDLIDLSANYPTAPLDPDLSLALRVLARRSDCGALLRYAPPEGLRRHRETLAAWLTEQRVPAHPDRIVMTAGTQHAIGLALDVLTKPGDTVACEALTYPGMEAAATSRGVRLLPVALDEKGLVPEAFEEICRANVIRAMYTIPTLHNPTSVSLSHERKEAIAAVAEKHSVTIIEDEIHRPFVARPAPPFAALAANRSVLVSSVSKSVAGGLRVGCVLAPDNLVSAFREAVQSSFVSTAPLNTEILRAWIEEGELKRTVARRRKEMAARQRLARRILGESDAFEPESPYAWIELPEHCSPAGIAAEARSRGVAIASGDLFAVDKANAPNAIRLALCAPASRPLLQNGLELLRNVLEGGRAPTAVTL